MQSILDAIHLLPQRVRAIHLAPILGVSQECVRLWGKNGTLPPPVRTGKRILTWGRDELLMHFQKREGVNHAGV